MKIERERVREKERERESRGRERRARWPRRYGLGNKNNPGPFVGCESEGAYGWGVVVVKGVSNR